MKVYGKLLVLCVFHPDVWGTTAFLPQVPKALALKGRQTTDALTTSFLSVGDAYNVAGISGSKEGDVPVRAASKINSTVPVATVGENQRVRRPGRFSLYNKKYLS
jgi:hypothetical protein